MKAEPTYLAVKLPSLFCPTVGLRKLRILVPLYWSIPVGSRVTKLFLLHV